MTKQKKDNNDPEEFYSKRNCDFCNSQEGEMRKVGQYIVELNEIEHDGETKLACQGCKRKIKSMSAFQDKYNNGKRFSFLRKLFFSGFQQK
ncbi:MAG: hypothetical protein ED557_07545 [Balneola sp.]|nr:MAG: hypothetical protein ED557_07545 [Balneola sp.]